MTMTSEIGKLTDDCLIEIFQHLTTIADKVRIERVCKRWQRVSQKSWNSFKSLDFSAETWGLDENGSVEQLSIRTIDFEKIIRLSGRYLTRISTDIRRFGKICHLLPNIRELQLSDDWKTDSLPCTFETCCQVVLSWLISHGKSIKLFYLELIVYFKEEDFVRVLREMKQLETLHLYNRSGDPDWSGICLLELPFDMIQEIFLIDVIKDSEQNTLSTMLMKCKKLQTFCLEKYKVDGILEALSSQADTLKNLKLKFFFPRDQYVLLSTMSDLIHLEKLDVSSCRIVSDAFLEVVSKHCKKLTYLNLMDCDKITDAGISSICNLKRLTYLNIGGLPKIKNPPLEKLTRVVVLDTSWNVVEMECLCTFLRRAPQLRALNVGGCRSVTNELLNATAAKIRNSNNKLDLYVYDTSINPEILSRIPPFVNVMKWNDLPFARYGVENPFRDRDDPQVFIT